MAPTLSRYLRALWSANRVGTEVAALTILGEAAVGTETFTSTSAPIQYAAVRAFQEGPEIEEYLKKSRQLLKALGSHIAGKLNKCGIKVRAPHGGFYLFPDFSPFRENLSSKGVSSSTEMCHKLLEDTGVAILPGSNFGRGEEELLARLAYVDFDGRAGEGSRRDPSIDKAGAFLYL